MIGPVRPSEENPYDFFKRYELGEDKSADFLEKWDLRMKKKKCIYCNMEFTDIDFPRTFERMVTCGSIECMQKRRQERYTLRLNNNNNKI